MKIRTEVTGIGAAARARAQALIALAIAKRETARPAMPPPIRNAEVAPASTPSHPGGK
jgi:hypothetical protein